MTEVHLEHLHEVRRTKSRRFGERHRFAGRASRSQDKHTYPTPNDRCDLRNMSRIQKPHARCTRCARKTAKMERETFGLDWMDDCHISQRAFLKQDDQCHGCMGPCLCTQLTSIPPTDQAYRKLVRRKSTWKGRDHKNKKVRFPFNCRRR